MNYSPLCFLAPRWPDAVIAQLQEDAAVRVAALGRAPSRSERRSAVVAAMSRPVTDSIHRDLRRRHRPAAHAAWRRWATEFAFGYPDVAAAVAAGVDATRCNTRRKGELRIVLTDLVRRWTQVATDVPIGGSFTHY